MESCYYLYRRNCPYCGKEIDEIIMSIGRVTEDNYDENGEIQDHAVSRCNHCGKKFRIDIKFEIAIIGNVYENEK